MKNTVAYEKGKNEVAHRAYGHTREKDGWRQTDQSPTSAVLGDGGIYSSLDDLEKWDGALREHTLLGAAEMEPALTPVQPSGGAAKFADGPSVSYGFGWFLRPLPGAQAHVARWGDDRVPDYDPAVSRGSVDDHRAG